MIKTKKTLLIATIFHVTVSSCLHASELMSGAHVNSTIAEPSSSTSTLASTSMCETGHFEEIEASSAATSEKRDPKQMHEGDVYGHFDSTRIVYKGVTGGSGGYGERYTEHGTRVVKPEPLRATPGFAYRLPRKVPHPLARKAIKEQIKRTAKVSAQGRKLIMESEEK